MMGGYLRGEEEKGEKLCDMMRGEVEGYREKTRRRG